MNDNLGAFNVIRAAEYGIITLPEPVSVSVQWEGGEREFFNGVTRAYVSNNGSLTLMGAHGKAVGRVALLNQTRTHKRKGRVVSTMNAQGGLYTLLLEVSQVF